MESQAAAEHPAEKSDVRQPFEDKLTMQPDKFGGLHEQWRDWSFIFCSYVASLDVRTRELMDQVSSMTEQVSIMKDNLDDARRSRTLFHLLTMSMQPKTRGFEIIRNVQNGNGLEAWRQLTVEYEQRLRGGRMRSHSASLDWLLQPKFKMDDDLMESIETWERAIIEYQVRANVEISEADRSDVLVSGQLDEKLQRHLIENVHRLKDYETLRAEIMDYITNQQVCAEDESSTVKPMDVHAVPYGEDRKGKGKKHSKGDGDKLYGKGKAGKSDKGKGKDKADRPDKDKSGKGGKDDVKWCDF